MSWFSNFAKSALDGLGSSFGSGLLGGITGFIGNAQQSRNIDKQIRAQQEENQKNREYNFMLAQKQNQWNIDQWNRENAYNDPSQQMSRFRDAGLNPDMMMASGASNLSADSPQMSSGAPSSPVDMSALAYKPTVTDAMNSAINSASVSAEVRKKDTESEKINKDIYWQDVMGAKDVTLKDIHIELGRWDIAQTPKRAEILAQELRNMQATWTKTWSAIKLDTANERYVRTQGMGQKIRNSISQKELDHYEERFGWERETFFKNMEHITSQIAVNGSVVFANNAFGRKANAEAYQVEFHNGILDITRLSDEDYKSIAQREHVIHMGNLAVQEEAQKADKSAQQNRQTVEGVYEDYPLLLGIKESLAVAGQVFGANVGYNVNSSTSTSHSTSHVTSRSTSNNINTNYRGN